MIFPIPSIGAASKPPSGPSPLGGGGGAGFGGLLAGEVGKLEHLQQQATTAAQDLATGKATDVSSVAMEVERASLALQLAVQIRNKAVDAYQELFRMQV